MDYQSEVIRQLMYESSQQFPSSREHSRFFLEAAAKHAVEIAYRLESNDPHAQKEAADLYIIASLLMNINEVPEEIVTERVGRFREKIQAALEKK